ncbi:myosin-binding protein 1-like [Panicum miliaceum]|uniref:Myosin-binding protein 1-like n=1 Tax=Panicum miliaceum TaxID=4540 RepID=A0A3L6TJ39_PANMI|nr:myosin-binding protein 1-like [Panicum miliaceum]
MAVKTSSGSQDCFWHRFWPMLSYACGELFVIILLYVAALASYAATRLAHICRLKVPCIFCTRLDHALHGKAWFSADLVCTAHASEISSLAYCKSHDQLARSDDLCKTCLLACKAVVASEEASSSSRSRSRGLCSCCSELFKNTHNAQKHSETANAVESRSHAYASDNIVAMAPRVVPEQVPADHPKEKAFVVGIEEHHESDGRSRKDSGPSANAGIAKPATYRSAAPICIAVDRNTSVKNVLASRVNLTSPRPSEIISARDSNSTTQQEVKALLSQMSSVRGLDSSLSEGTPRPGVNVQTEESNPTSKKPSFDRNYSVLEPSDGSLTDDIEGESSLENVKKQLDLNKKSMAALYKELEEERSASAVAASQTMAMINRLQEEKAAMQMEALQYLRMMEQQADHDHEAIQNLHDLLTEREKELLDMDAELASCRRLLESEPFNGARLDATDTMNNTIGDRNLAFEFMNGLDFVRSTMSRFEDEKAYILESLSRLEEILGISTNRLAFNEISQEDILFEDHTRADGRYRENSQLDEHMSGESTSDQQHGGHEMVEDNKDKCSCSPSHNDNMGGVASIKNEISLLNTRLMALEVDQEFLKQVLSSLQYGSDGLRCIQEITSHLAELRRVAIQ